MLKGITIILVVMFMLLEYRFWFSKDSILEVLKLRKTIDHQTQEVKTIQDKNRDIYEWIQHLKKSPVAIEEHARYELGMIRRGEKFYQIVEPIE